MRRSREGRRGFVVTVLVRARRGLTPPAGSGVSPRAAREFAGAFCVGARANTGYSDRYRPVLVRAPRGEPAPDTRGLILS